MPNPIDQPDQPQIGHSRAHRLNHVDAGHEAQNRIEASGDEGCWLINPPVRDCRLLREIQL